MRHILFGVCMLVLCHAVFSQNTVVEIFPGIPLRDSVSQAQKLCYKVAIPASARSGKTLTITVTPLGEGDPDLYVDFTECPTATAPYIARDYGQDSVSIPSDRYPADAQYVHAAVFGFRNVNYTILASYENVVSLTDGIPQSGTVQYEGMDYFILNTSTFTQHTDLTISATPLRGRIALLVGASFQPLRNNYTWSSRIPYNGEALVIYKNDARWPADGIFYIAVYGATNNSAYSLVAATNKVHIILRDGIPVQEHAETGETEYFRVDVANAGCALAVTVTPITGDPDLFMSTEIVYPDRTHFNRSSSKWGADQITYDPAPPGAYYIGVSAWRNSTFTITASTTCGGNGTQYYQFLLDGIPQDSLLTAGQSKFYRFDVVGHHRDLTISVTRAYGDPDLYVLVGDRPSPTNYTWSSTHFGNDLITISTDDAAACDPTRGTCTYIILVYAASSCYFTIQSRTQAAISTLQDGIPFREDLSARQYEYFKFPVDVVPYVFSVVVTNLGAGDPDLYISLDNSHPNATNYTWASRRWGGDTLTIASTDLNACIAPPCMYYISVYANYNTTFTILARFTNTSRLQDGIPQVGTVSNLGMNYYSLYFDRPHVDVTFNLNIQTGRALMYISDVAYPTMYAYKWGSSWFGSVKTIRIYETDPKACNTTTCEYIVGVYGLSDATYSISASTAEATIPLIQGIPVQRRTEPGNNLYFSTRVENYMVDLSIAVTALSGDPDIYVSNTTARPNAANYTWSSRKNGDDEVYIPNAVMGTYYIGVVAATRNTTFAISSMLVNQDSNTTNIYRLLEGQPQRATLGTGHYRYYIFQTTSAHQELEISITKELGDPDIYVSLGADSRPNRSNFTWASSTNGNDLVEITTPAIGTYVIAVYAYTTCVYSIRAFTTDGTVYLEDGVPVRGSLYSNQWAYYVLDLETETDFTVSVTPLSGDPDMYISTTYEHPNSTNYDWMSTNYRSDSITIPKTHPKSCVGCSFYIGVRAYSPTTYYITATFQNNVQLENGKPQSDSVARGAFKYYTIRLLDDSADLTVSLTPRAGTPRLYISAGYEPTNTNYTWISYFSFGSSQIQIRPTDPKYCQSSDNRCVYYIGVRGEGSAEVCNFTLTATSRRMSISLQDGVPMTEAIDNDQWEYFTFDVPTTTDLLFTVTALTGDPDVFVSDKYPQPNSTNTPSIWQSQSIGSDTVIVSNAHNGTWFIGVHAFRRNSSFVITASTMNSGNTSTIIMLVNGQPQNGYLGARTWRYYEFIVDSSMDHIDVSFSVFRIIGDPDLYVTDNGLLPTLTNFTYRSADFGQDLVTINNPRPATYIIGVYGFQTTQYSLTATTSAATTQLRDGIPFREDLPAKSYEYFYLDVDRVDMDLTVSVTSFNGDPDLCISDVHDHPQHPNCTFSARAYRDDSYTIPVGTLHMGRYWISVYAFTNCTFTITASFSSEVYLQDGVPQADNARWEQSKYYQLQVGQIDDLTISLTPFSGNVHLFVTSSNYSGDARPVKGNVSTYFAASTRYYSSQVITLRSGAPYVCSNCTYTIMAWGGSIPNATYSLTASSTRTLVNLQDGVPLNDHVNARQYEYFSFQVNNPNSAVIFSVTAISGDPDVYVSTKLKRPDTQNFTWSATNFGGDVVHIDSQTDRNFIVGTYYIAVYAFTNTSFTITASVVDLSTANNATGDVLLINGSPQSGLIFNSTENRYYTFIFPPATSSRALTITVTPKWGDPDIYIRIDGERASRSAYNYSATEWGRDSITIPAPCSSCMISILVTSYSPSLFTIFAVTGDVITQLQNNVPFMGYVAARSYKYFAFQVDRNDIQLVLSCTTLSSGADPDLYISDRDDIRYPNMTSYVYRANSFGSDVWVLDGSKIKIGTYFVGVYGFRNSTFTLTASLGSTMLLNGEPHTDSLQYNQVRYYNFHMSTEPYNLTFSMAFADNGNAIMYVSTTNETPGPNDYTWNSMNATAGPGTRNTIEISMDQYNACTDCEYYVAVKCLSPRVAYTLTATIGNKTMTLVAGSPIATVVSNNNYKFFRTVVDEDAKDVVFAITTLTGTVKAFVSNTTDTPMDGNCVNCIVSTNSVFTIPKATVTTGFYYIGVLGKSTADAYFTLSVSTHNTLLRAGIPSTGQSNGDDGTYFLFNVDWPSYDVASDIRLELRYMNNDAHYIIAISSDPSVTEPPKESDPNNPRTASFTVLSSVPYVTIAKASTLFNLSSPYYIGVYSTVADDYFTLTASTTESYQVLAPDSTGMAVAYSQAAPNSFRYLEMYAEKLDNFDLTVDVCAGDVDIYMSQATYLPSEQAYTWSYTTPNTLDHYTVKDKLMQGRQTLYIGVKNLASTNAEFIVKATTNPTTNPVEIKGDQGKIVLSTHEANSITVSFRKLINYATPSSLTYTVYYSKDADKRAMYSFCGVARSSEAVILKNSDSPSDTFVWVIRDLEPRVSYQVNVVVKNEDGHQGIYTFQTVSTLSPDDISGGGGSLKYILGIGIPVCIVLVIGIIYLFVRNRKLTKELDVEMHDIPKSAFRKAVRGPPSVAEGEQETKPNKKAQKYSRLLTEDEEDPFPENYIPPSDATTTS